MRPLIVGAAVLVTYLTVGLQPAVAAANLLQNGDFSQGLTGWQEVCDTFGEQPVAGAHCTSTSANGLTVTGSYPYTGAQQTVATSTNVVLSGTVTVANMATCNVDDGVLVRAILRDASSTEIGRLTFYHHPYPSPPGCSTYAYPNDSTHYYRDMPSWMPGPAQGFQMDIGALMANLPGVDPAAVRSITVELLDYADTAAPTLSFSSFDLSSGSAPPSSGAPVNTAPPAILGTPQQGDTLTVSHGSWKGTVTGYAYQWFACDGPGASCSPIAGATGTTYTLRASDVGRSIFVQETAFNGGTAGAPALSGLVGRVVPATAPPPPPPPPVLGKSVDVSTVSGVVFVTLPNGQSVPVSGALSLPSGTQVDARAGSLRLTTAAARRGQTQTGVFGGAVFKIAQTAAGASRGLTTLSLVEGAKGAPSYRSCRTASGRSAHAARLSSRVLQTLHSTVHGKFRTRGRYSAGTVRGTSWDTSDRCDGTLTVVHRGTVLVTDFARHRTVAVHAGHSYFAKAG